jgi:uncharacterized protein (DUF433 family)
VSDQDAGKWAANEQRREAAARREQALSDDAILANLRALSVYVDHPAGGIGTALPDHVVEPGYSLGRPIDYAGYADHLLDAIGVPALPQPRQDFTAPPVRVPDIGASPPPPRSDPWLTISQRVAQLDPRVAMSPEHPYSAGEVANLLAVPDRSVLNPPFLPEFALFELPSETLGMRVGPEGGSGGARGASGFGPSSGLGGSPFVGGMRSPVSRLARRYAQDPINAKLKYEFQRFISNDATPEQALVIAAQLMREKQLTQGSPRDRIAAAAYYGKLEGMRTG